MFRTRHRAALLALALALLAIAHAPAAAAVIRGNLRAPAGSERTTSAPDPYAGRAGSMAAAPLRRGALRDAVIWIEGASPGGVSADSLHASRRVGQLAQKDQSFSPRVVPVVAGGQIEFPNRDPIYHNVFSVSPAKRFDLGKYGRGKSRSVRFDKPGVVKVYCDIHSNMEGFVLVLPNPWFARAADDGSFELPVVTAGTYRVKAWHPDLGERTLSVTVGEDETREVEVSF
jgi:plastocyanin